MQLSDPTRSVVAQLCEYDFSEHFEIRYSLRTPPPGTLGRGRFGVRRLYLIADYLESMERLYRTLTSPPFAWRKVPTGKLQVFALNLAEVDMYEPFTTLDNARGLYICLPCRSEEPMLQLSVHKSAVEAVHEATHAFSWWARPPLELIEAKWFWFLEATAVFMEGYVFPGNLDSIRFALDWCEFPDRSLDSPTAWYQSGFFARYLASRYGAELISKLWNDSLPTDTPFTALNGLLPAADMSPSQDICRIFGEYAHDSFFLWDRTSPGFHNEVFVRFGHRAFTECFVLSPGGVATAEWALDHLACRYFRVEIPSGITRLTAIVRIKGADPALFRCFLTSHLAKQKRGRWRELAPQNGYRKQPVPLTATLQDNDLKDCDWFLLTIANCGLRSAKTEPFGKPHDDNKTFSVELRAYT